MFQDPPIEELFAELQGAQDNIYECREERKYVLSEAASHALREVFASRLALEEFVPGRLRTLVHSIYFDSPEWTLYSDSMRQEGSLKFRLRGYATKERTSEVDSNVYFECKLGVQEGMAGKKKKKLRFMVPHALATMLFERRAARQAATGMLTLAPQPKFWRKALHFVAAKHLIPRLTICYERTAYVSEDGRLRITLDEHFEASSIHSDNTSRLGEAHGRLPGVVILEIKFLGEFPAWVVEALNRVGLLCEGQAFSKFKTAVPMLFPELQRIVPESHT
jgi:SPX domain protein involved in polyphosphate accumulation